MNQSCGKKLACTIVTPSVIDLPNDDNVTVSIQGAARAITFSPMEKESQQNANVDGQIIDH